MISCFALLAACQNKADEPFSKAGRPKKDSRYARILAKCKVITIDTLQVYSAGEGINADTFQYIGVPIDSVDAKLFPPEVADGMLNGGTGIYACYTFAMDESHTGMIVRTPAMYDATSIKLFSLDNALDTLTGFIELAEQWGDAGDELKKTSWLYRDQKMRLHAYLWVQETFDHSVENEKDTVVDRTDHYCVLDLSKPKYDTINKNAGALLKTFQAVVRN